MSKLDLLPQIPHEARLVLPSAPFGVAGAGLGGGGGGGGVGEGVKRKWPPGGGHLTRERRCGQPKKRRRRAAPTPRIATAARPSEPGSGAVPGVQTPAVLTEPEQVPTVTTLILNASLP